MLLKQLKCELTVFDFEKLTIVFCPVVIKKSKIIYILFLLAIINSVKLSAQIDSSKIEFNVRIRERFELWNGMNAKNYGDDSPNAIGSLNDKMLLQRVIAGINLRPISWLNISFHLQDSRAFGWSLRNAKYPDAFKVGAKNTKEPYYIMNPNEEFFEIHDLYLSLREALKNLTFTFGRQKIAYGDNRIFGPGDWGNTGRWTWDAFKISYKNKSNFIDVFAGGTKIHDPERISIPFTKTEFWGGGLYAHYDWDKISSFEPFYAIKKPGSAPYANTFNLTRQWIGLRLFNNDFHHFVYDFTMVKELGKENGKSIDAFGIVGKLGYQFYFIPANPIFAIRESYASGGKNSDSKIKTFDFAFGSKDQYYGWMNITSWSNLDDREILIHFFPIKNMRIETNFHWFYIPVPDDVTLLGTMKLQEGKHFLGNEFNLYFNYQVLKQLQIISISGYFIPGDLRPINNHSAKSSFWFSFQMLYQWTAEKKIEPKE